MKLFVGNFIKQNAKQTRSVLILAQNAGDAGSVAEELRNPGEKIGITEAHEPLVETNGNGVYRYVYEGLDEPEPDPRTLRMAEAAGQAVSGST